MYAWHILHLQMLEFDRQRLNAMTPEARATELHRRMMKRILEKDERMARRLARYRASIWKRRWGRFAGAVLLLCAVPVALLIVSELWRLAMWSLTR